MAQYICDTTVVDFVAHHELRIDHVYETFYTLIMGLLMYIRTHPDVPDETVKEIIASTLHIEGYTAKYPGAQAPELTTFGQTARDQKRGRGRVNGEQHAVRRLG